MNRIVTCINSCVILCTLWASIIYAQIPVFILSWGSQGTADGQFMYPGGVASDADGNVYVVDIGNHRVQKFTSSGEFLLKWGSRGSDDGQFSYPMGVTLDAGGNVYIGDGGNHRI